MPVQKVLVAAASKYGATAAIAREIGRVLAERGFDTRVEDVNNLRDAEDFDAIVLGSAIYSGRWLAAAREFIRANRHSLTRKPVWLFSSGPLGKPALPPGDPVDARPLLAQSHARGHRIFGGKLDLQRLNFAERAIVYGLQAPVGDYRDWPAIQAWAEEIADELENSATAQ